MNESNYVPPGGGKISNSRTMSIDDPRLKMVARIPLNPTRSPSSPADSLNSVGDMQLGPPTPKKGQTANPFIIPGRVYTESQQLEADQKWVDAQEGAKNLLNGGSTDDISTDVKSAAINLAREQGWKPSSLKKEPTLSDKLSFQTTVKNDPWVKDFPIVQRSYRAMVSALDSALKAGADKKSKASADQALITLFNKMLDPTSVVREGEYSRSEQGQSFLQQAQSWVQQAAGGGAKITDESRQEMVNIAKTLYKNSLKDYSTALDSYEAQAVDSGIDPSVYLRRNDLEELKPKANPPQGQIWVKEIGGGVGSIPSKEFDPKKFIKL